MEELQSLKSKILSLAIQGKLTAQSENDEPASLLLEKIKQEKERLVKEKKIKKDKFESTIYKKNNCWFEKIGDTEKDITKDIPFDIPDSWQWVRLGVLGQYKKGPFGSSLKKSIFVPKSDDAIKVYEQKNAINKNHLLGRYYISKDYFENNMQSFEVVSGDIIVSCAGTIGETYILPEGIEKGIINQALMKISLVKLINKEYFLHFFENIIKENSKEESKGTAIKNIPPFSIFKQMLFPLPPLAEQQRIVKKIEEIFKQIDIIQTNKEELDKLKLALKNKMLSLAIQGKLVKQTETDTPVAELLQKIQEEKERLVKEKKIKKDKFESRIYKKDSRWIEKIGDMEKDITNDIPFDIPDSWQWVRLGMLCNVIMGQSPDGTTISSESNGVEFHQGKLFFDSKYLKKSSIITSSPKKIAPINSILLCVRAPVGKINITPREISIGRGLCAIQNYDGYLLDFLYNTLLLNENILVSQATGSTFQSITVDTVINLLVPLPPLEQQYRITQKLEEILSACERI